MIDSRWSTAAVGVAASLALSVALFLYTGSLLFFLLVPFVPFLFRGRSDEHDGTDGPPVRECRQCDFRTRDPSHEYCPRDGSRLTTPRDY